VYQKAPELTGIQGYINTPRLSSGEAGPITIGEFKGKKVVLIDIWTYSCINCQRTLPYIKMWYDKYKDQGLEIIGVHTPEFAFERVLSNVQNAVNNFGIKYPVVLDNAYATWNVFGNQFWPRKYLIDIDGYIVYDHAGEGNYDQTEKAIQKALAERAARLGTTMSTTGVSNPTNVVSVDNSKLGSPETYFGAERNEYLGNGKKGQLGLQSLQEPITVNTNTLYLIGEWDFVNEYAETASTVGGSAGSDRVDYRYKAKNVYFVAGSKSGAPIEVEVLRDSKPLEHSFAGADVHFRDGKSYVTITGNKLYHIIGDQSGYGEHFLELIISSPGLQAYTFTFG
jgi:thiol-disulfide isomerase/thioredoxin